MKKHAPQTPPEVIGIIAGTGTLPIHAAECLHVKQKNFFVLSLFPEDNANKLRVTLTKTEQLVALPFYKIGAIKKLLKQRNTTHVLLVGKIDKRHLLKKISYDWEFVKLATQLLYKNDTAIMTLLVKTLEDQGITVLKQSEILSSLLLQPGLLCGTMTPTLERDITFGITTAHNLSALDIGQTVVVKDGMILAVEAIEGTDECISRGVALGKREVVICKTARTSQNKRFDIPTLGPATLEKIEKGTVKAIAWHAQRTLIADADAFISQAQKKNITLISLSEPTIQQTAEAVPPTTKEDIQSNTDRQNFHD